MQKGADRAGRFYDEKSLNPALPKGYDFYARSQSR
jgi:hypothetical protein